MAILASIPKLQTRCRRACSNLLGLLHQASLDFPPDEKAWGQFLDYAQANRQHGVYGTACAVKTLVILGEPANSDFVVKGEQWLLHSLREENSPTNRKKDYTVTYKYCFLLEALEPSADEVSNSVAPLFDGLLQRRLGNTGWGEYYFSDEHRSDEPGIIPTALALCALRRYVPFAGSEQCKEPLEWLESRILDRWAEVSPLEVALLVLVLDAYSKKHAELGNRVASTGQLLERKIKEAHGTGRVGDWYPHHFSVCDPESGRWRNQYIYFPTDAIVVTALIRGGRFWQNQGFVNKAMHWYLKNIEKNGGFCQPQLRRIATVDHYWLALAMREFLNVNPKGFLASKWEWLTARSWRYNLFVRGPSTILILGLYTWLTYFQSQWPNLGVRAVIGTVLAVMLMVLTWVWWRPRH